MQMSEITIGNYQIQGKLVHRQINQCKNEKNQHFDCQYLFNEGIKQDIRCENINVQQDKMKQMQSEIFALKDNNLVQHIQIRDAYNLGIGYLLVMDQVKHKNLEDYIQANSFSQSCKQFQQIICSILKGLKEIHKRCITYLILSPQNLLFDGKQIIFKDISYDRVCRISSLTQEENMFIAPEVFGQGKYSFSADVYSFGILLYYMIFKKYPFNSEVKINQKEVTQDVQDQRIDFNIGNNKISCCMIDFIKRCLKYNTRQRLTWAQLYQHPFIRNMKLQAEENNAALESYIDFYQQQMFKQDQIIELNTVQIFENIKNEKIIKEIAKQHITQAMKELELIIEGIKFLKTFVKAIFKSYESSLELNVPIFFILKKRLQLIEKIQISISTRRNIFNISYLDLFINHRYCNQFIEQVKFLQEKDYEQYQKIQKQALLESKVISIKTEIESKECTNNFDTNYKNILIDLISQLKQKLNQSNNIEISKQIFSHIMLTFKAIKIDQWLNTNFNYIDYISEQNKQNPFDYDEIIKKYMNQLI